MEDQDFVARRRRQIRRQIFQRRELILFLIILLLLIGIFINFIPNSYNIVSLIFTGLAVLVAAITLLFPEISTALARRSSLDPPSEPSRPVRSQTIVREIYNRLRDPNCSAIVFLGLNGIGATSLAKQVYTFIEDRRPRLFFKRALWVELDKGSTLADLARRLGLRDVSHWPYGHQADQLLTYLDTPKRRWLIVLDFKNPLSEENQDVLVDRPGFSEFLHLLNSRACESRFLLTSRPWSSESYNDPPWYMKEYHVEGLEDEEGIELLRQCRVKGTVDEQLWAIDFCRGHVGALRILPKILAGPPTIELSSVIKNASDRGKWMREITRKHLEHIYQALSDVEKDILFAFSVYRRPVQLEAVQAVMDDQLNVRGDELRDAHRKLMRCCFFLNSQGAGYQLHPLVARHARQHFGDLNNPRRLQEAHRKAAEYYEGDARGRIGIGMHRERAELYIEALYHWLMAGEDGEAERLLRERKLLRYLLGF